MNTQLEGAVRKALDDLVMSPVPPDLARGAIGRAGRQRAARRWVTGVAAVAAALVAVPLVAAGLTGGDGNRGTSAAGQAPPVKPFVVTAYSGIAADADPGPADDYSMLLNPATGEYEKVPYNEVVPSADGSRVLVLEGDNSQAHPSRRGLWDRASGQVRWLSGHAGYTSGAAWSPDGRQILITDRPREKAGTAGGFLLVDAETLATRKVEVPDVDRRNVVGAVFVWTPDGKGLALTHSTLSGGNGPGKATAVGFYDLSGRLTRTVPVADGLLADGSQFSPDGKQIALSEPLSGRRVWIVDAASGVVRQQFSMSTSGTVLGWYDSTHLIVTADGDRIRGERPRITVVDLTGRVTATAPFAAGATVAQRVHVGSSTQVRAGAGKLAF